MPDSLAKLGMIFFVGTFSLSLSLSSSVRSNGVGTYDGLYGSYCEKLGGLASMLKSSAGRDIEMRMCYFVLRHVILCHVIICK